MGCMGTDEHSSIAVSLGGIPGLSYILLRANFPHSGWRQRGRIVCCFSAFTLALVENKMYILLFLSYYLELQLFAWFTKDRKY